MSSSIDQLFDLVAKQNEQRVRLTVDEAEALARQSREVTRAMALVVAEAKKLVGLATTTTDLDHVGATISMMARVHHILDEYAERWEERAKKVCEQVRSGR